MFKVGVDKLIELIFPTRCISCRSLGSLFCEDCLSRLKPLDKFYCLICEKPAVGGFTHPGCATRYTPERSLSSFWYRGSAKRAIKALKYKKIWLLAGLLSQLLADDLQEKGISFGEGAIIVPVPLSFWRKGKRGFNQTELLGLALKDQLGLLFRADLLERVKETLSQTGLSREERVKNIKSAFKVRESLQGEDLLLIDDVLTTGETVRECSRVLKKAGAGQVWVLTFAKD